MKKPGPGQIMPPLWTVEIHFNYEGDLKKWNIENRSALEVMEIRQTIFSTGFNFQKTPTHSEIIFPCDLVRIWIDLQKGWQE